VLIAAASAIARDETNTMALKSAVLAVGLGIFSLEGMRV
jgi:hypothetical protein